jgi:triosephosphate isomerase
MTERRPLVAGNWKMNGVLASKAELQALVTALADKPSAACDVMIAPPFTLLAPFVETAAGTPVLIASQDCSPLAPGAHTGDVAAVMLKDLGVAAAIVGHSERRQDHHELDDLVRHKAEAAYAAGLEAIICIGETEPERDRDETLDVVTRQLAGSVPDAATADNTVIAYEPVWAIGTGRTPTADDVAKVHGTIREVLVERFGDTTGNGIRILYGGSVKPANAGELMAVANVDGALVGGASLKADDFDGIIDAYR